ncbi:MAG: hypothetical protein HY540_05830, partial [Deltaproteobacteria bacterium]|nr:hypothetical protein [Deltaproteobacteria bacterium]
MSFIAPLQTGVSSLLNSAQAFLASAVVGPTVSPTIVQSLPVQPVAPVVGVLLSQQPSTFLLLRPANPSYLLRYELPVSRQEMAPPVVSFPTVFVPAAVTTLPAEFHPDEGAALEQHAARFQGEAPVQRLRSSHSTSPQGSTRMV